MKKTLNIIGAGRVGRVFGLLFARHGAFDIGQVLNRSPASAVDAVAFIGAGTAVADIAVLRHADVWLLAVGDDQIAACAAQLAARGLLDASSIVFHCSGALSSAQLQAARDAGAACASVHPVRSFADPAHVAAHFAATFCSLEGDPPALAILAGALAAIGARSLTIAAADKPLYHAGSVFASNYLASLLDVALRTYCAAGVPPELARELAAPLIRETLDNVLRLGPADALTGPIARGDMALVARQLETVEAWDPQAGALYRAFIAPTVALAGRKTAVD